jgi:hypothetical protein
MSAAPCAQPAAVWRSPVLLPVAPDECQNPGWTDYRTQDRGGLWRVSRCEKKSARSICAVLAEGTSLRNCAGEAAGAGLLKIQEGCGSLHSVCALPPARAQPPAARGEVRAGRRFLDVRTACYRFTRGLSGDHWRGGAPLCSPRLTGRSVRGTTRFTRIWSHGFFAGVSPCA